MKKLLITAALMAVTATAASAQGALFLNWQNCYPHGTAAINRNDNCYVCPNSADQRIILSFTAPTAMNVGSTTSLIEATFPGPQPDYWRFDAAGCRSGAATIANTYLGTNTLCPDIMGGSSVQVPIFGSFPGQPTPNKMRMVLENTRDNFLAVTAGSHYTAVQLNISHFKTTVDCDASTPDPTPVCTGCAQPVTLQLLEMFITQAGGGGQMVTTPGTRNYVYSQSGVGVPTPTRNKSWGAVKSLYR